MEISFSQFEMDQLKEVVNIGASRASDVLSTLVNNKVALTIPEAANLRMDDMVKYIGKENMQIAAVTIDIAGEAIGIMLFLFPEKSAHRVARLIDHNLVNNSDDGHDISEEEKKALKKVSDIMAQAYVGALADFLKIKLIQKVSDVYVGKLGEVIKEKIEILKKESDTGLIFRVSLAISGIGAETRVFLMTGPKFSCQLIELTRRAFGV